MYVFDQLPSAIRTNLAHLLETHINHTMERTISRSNLDDLQSPSPQSHLWMLRVDDLFDSSAGCVHSEIAIKKQSRSRTASRFPFVESTCAFGTFSFLAFCCSCFPTLGTAGGDLWLLSDFQAQSTPFLTSARTLFWPASDCLCFFDPVPSCAPQISTSNAPPLFFDFIVFFVAPRTVVWFFGSQVAAMRQLQGRNKDFLCISSYFWPLNYWSHFQKSRIHGPSCSCIVRLTNSHAGHIVLRKHRIQGFDNCQSYLHSNLADFTW